MKLRHYLAALVVPLLLSFLLAGQAPPPRKLVARPGMLGEYGAIFLSDFATPQQARGFALLKAGKMAEAAALFAEDLKTDTTGMAAVGLAQATLPNQWPAQIKELDDKLSRNQSDVRVAFRLSTLLYYDGVSRMVNGYMPDTTEFDRATLLYTDLWKRYHDPLSGLMLTEMTYRFRTNNGLQRDALLENLIGAVGGKAAQTAFARAKQTGFTTALPLPDIVAPQQRHALAGVLVGLWTETTKVTGRMDVFDKNHHLIPADQRKMVDDVHTPGQNREAAWLDAWIKTLNPARWKAHLASR